MEPPLVATVKLVNPIKNEAAINIIVKLMYKDAISFVLGEEKNPSYCFIC